MNKERILKQIEKAGDNFFSSGPVSDDAINQIEKELGVKLPESYKWYVREFGHGGIGNVEIYGVALNNVLTCVDRTKSYREYGLPKEYVEILNKDEYIFCLDTARMKDGECPVVDWDQGSGTGNTEYANFLEFVYKQFEEKLKFLEDEGLL